VPTTLSDAEIVEHGWLRRERDELLTLLRGLGDDDWGRPTECPAWTVKQVALHLLGDDLSLLSRQRDGATNSLVLFAEDHPGADVPQLLDGFNEQWATASTFLSNRIVIELLQMSGDETAAFYESVDPASLGEPVMFFGSSDPSPYWHVFSREFVERWVHQHQIRRAVGAPELGRAILAVAAGVFVRSIAIQLGDLGVAYGAAIGIEVPDVAAWSLRWGGPDRGWALSVGTAPDITATVVLYTETATRLLTRGPILPEMGEPATVAGDPSVGTAALIAVAGIFRPSP
jgi:uncharacterized protein (TIGR03083 family)